METSSLSLGFAFLAGLASFLSPCVLPIVPSYVSFITGRTLDELRAGGTAHARREAALHSALFVLGFGALFVALGASATALGEALGDALPLLQRIGGAVIVLFGLSVLGILRLPALMRERRVQLRRRPAGWLGSLAVGVAFGAGWTPCIGPVLATILLYAGLQGTMLHGTLLLGAYALGLGIPFFVAAVGVNWFLAGAGRLRRFIPAIERVTGAFLVAMGVLLLTGHFAALSRFFAGFGQLINLEM